MPVAKARRAVSEVEVVKLPPTRPEDPPAAAAPPTTTNRPRGGLALARRSNGQGGGQVARARALQREDLAIESRPVTISSPASPRTGSSNQQQQLERAADQLPPMHLASPKASPSGAAPTPAPPRRPASPGSGASSAKRGPRKTKADKKSSATPLNSSSSAGSSKTPPTTPLVYLSLAPRLPSEAPALPAPSVPELPAPSLAELGGGKLKKAAAQSPSKRTSKASPAKASKRPQGAPGPSAEPLAFTSIAPTSEEVVEQIGAELEAVMPPQLLDSVRGVPAAARPPPASPAPQQQLPTALRTGLSLPTLPAAPMPTLPPSSERRLPTNELGSLFWNGLHSALAPAAMDEQWTAVRRLLVAC